MALVQTRKPLLFMLYGYPGAGKTYFSRQLADYLGLIHLQPDRLRYEIIQNPTYSADETETVRKLSDYMAGEFLRVGASVIYDSNATRLTRRRELRELARKYKAQPVLVWLQIDSGSAMSRAVGRDKRKQDDKYAYEYTEATFGNNTGSMQNPNQEDYIVVSGKHHFNTQKAAILKRLVDLGLVSPEAIAAKQVKPELSNLVPNLRAGRVDDSRRNIAIH